MVEGYDMYRFLYLNKYILYIIITSFIIVVVAVIIIIIVIKVNCLGQLIYVSFKLQETSASVV